MAQISILGCGWLGLPLADSLIKKGFEVKGSTTSQDKVKILTEKGIQPYLISLTNNGVNGNVEDFLKSGEILIIDIPPKLRKENSESFVEKIKALIPFIESSGITKVIFTSSTSVYNDDNSIVTEETIALPQSESGKQLVEVEKLLQNNTNFKTTVVRFGGLTGEDRQPVKFLAGKENLENPEAPVNIIHQQDCIGIIEKIIEKQAWGEIFNAVTPYHPSRREHYTKQAIVMKLPEPKFNSEKPSYGKTVSSKKIMTALGYQFKN